MSIIMLILAKPLASFIKVPSAYLAISALAPAILLTAIASAYRGYFQGRGDMNATAVSQVLEQFINLVFSIMFAALWRRYGVEAACAGATVGTTIGALISVVYLINYNKKNKGYKVPKDYNEIEIKRYSNKALFRKLINCSIPLTLSWGLQNAGGFIDTLYTKKRLLTAGFNDIEGNVKLGYLGKYQLLINVPITIISALCAAILPMVSGAAAVNDKIAIKRGIDYAFKTCLLIAIPSAVGLAVLSEPIFNTIFPKYSSGAVLMKYGSVVLIFMGIVQIQATILQSIGKLYISTLYIVVGIVAKIILNYILIAKPNINILGAVFGSMVAFLIPLLLNNYLIKKSLKIKYNLVKLSIRPLVAAAFMGIIVYLVQFDVEYALSFIYKGYLTEMLSTFAAIIAGILSYLYALILVGGITKEEIEIIPLRFRKFIPKAFTKRIR